MKSRIYFAALLPSAPILFCGPTSKLERETIILFNEEETTASVYTHNQKLTAKLRRMAEKFPDKVYPERREHPGAVSYIVPKSCISVREPYSEARRTAQSKQAKAAGVRPPRRGDN